MSDEQWLREGLAGAVPEPPGAPERASGARAMARRARRTTLLAAGGVAASVLVVAGVVAVLGNDGGAPDRVADGGGLSPLDVAACPASPVDAQTQVGPDHVPDGAVSVRLCAGDGTPVDVPADALVTRVGDVADAVNGLEVPAPDQACTDELGPGYQLVFGYDDKEPVVASGQLYGCRQVVVDGVERVGADVPWQAFIDLLRAQRAQLAPPAAPDAAGLGCSPALSSPSVAQARDLAAAVVCVDDPTGVSESRTAPVRAADVATLRADITANTHDTAGRPSCVAAAPPVRIVGLTSWGDRVELQPECSLERFVTDARTHAVWSPGADASAIVDRLVGEAG